MHTTAARAVAGAVTKNKSLQAICLDGNPLGAGAADMLQALQVSLPATLSVHVQSDERRLKLR
jgi:hypothetical protein